MTIRNTSNVSPAVHGMEMLLTAAVGGDPSAFITDMEARGQGEFVASEQFPRDAQWDDLTALGFVRGEDTEGDDLFCGVTLPSGWKREASDHDMWSYVVDERGVRRVGVFYKAAFYDRKATATIQPVGEMLATEAMYGDGDTCLPELWDKLTDKERAGFWVGVDRYLANAEQYPDSNLEWQERVKALSALRETQP